MCSEISLYLPVSYTHLDVYKRQPYNAETAEACIDAKSCRYAGSVDTTTRETIEASLFGNEEA